MSDNQRTLPPTCVVFHSGFAHFGRQDLLAIPLSSASERKCFPSELWIVFSLHFEGLHNPQSNPQDKAQDNVYVLLSQKRSPASQLQIFLSLYHELLYPDNLQSPVTA